VSTQIASLAPPVESTDDEYRSSWAKHTPRRFLKNRQFTGDGQVAADVSTRRAKPLENSTHRPSAGSLTGEVVTAKRYPRAPFERSLPAAHEDKITRFRPWAV